jgi:hypothetical protein
MLREAKAVVSVFVGLSLTISSFALAAPGTDAEKERLKKLPKRGTLSSSSTGGTAATTADGNWGVDSTATESAPIGGSASKISKSQWLMKVTNNSQKRSFKVKVELVQTDAKGSRLKGNHYTYTLKPGEEKSQRVDVLANTANCSLNLDDWSEVS